MSTKIIIGVVAAVVVAAGAWYYMGGMNPATTDDQSGAAALSGDERNTATATQGEGSLESLVALGGNYECTVTMDQQGTQSQGTVYISGTKVRGDFAAQAEGMTMNASMISDGSFVYTWSDLMPQGYKMAVTATGGSTGTAQSGFDMTAGVTYNCNPWTPETSKFVPPSNIQFQTL